MCQSRFKILPLQVEVVVETFFANRKAVIVLTNYPRFGCISCMVTSFKLDY